jgi:predicted ArsR family transcriptional regulator
MTQSQVMEHLAQTVGISKKDAKLALDGLNTLVVRELKKEGSIRLAGLGILRRRKLAAPGRPQSHYRRTDQDSGTYAAALHSGQSAERIGAGCDCRGGGEKETSA